MEIFSALLYTFLSIILFLKLLGISNRNSKLPLPPGPWKLPLLGNIHQLSASGSSSSSPHSVLRDLAKKYGPIMHLQFGEVSTVVVSSPETAQEVMKTHDIIFANRHQIIVAKILSYNSTNISFAPYGEYWRQMRKICTIEHLNAKKVLSFRNLRQEETSALIKWVGAAAASNGGGGGGGEKTINLTEKIFSSAFDFSSRSALGKKSKDQEVLIDLIAEGVKFAEGFNVADLFPSVKFFHLISGVKPAIMKLHRQTDSVLQKIINEHKKSYNTERDDADDLVDVLLKHQEGENQEFHLTENNIKAVIMDMISGGSETTATVIDWAMSEMLMNQSILKKAQEEVRQVFGSKGYVDEEDFKDLKYFEAVIKETLRIHPPTPLLVPRENSERCEIYGYEIPLKTKVIVNAWAINRDPRYWEDAECFKPERFLVESSPDFRGTNFEFIPFGAGRRVCPGITFGLEFVQLALAKLLYHFDWDLPMGTLPEKLDMSEACGITVRRKAHLHVVPTMHNPL